MIKPLVLSGACAVLIGCTAEVPDSGLHLTPSLVDASGQCYGRTTTPARIETVTRQVQVSPAITDADGTVTQPATFRTETEQRIVEERKIVEFETPCADEFTHEFVASLQRALGARGDYNGPIDGRLTPATGDAVRRYQSRFGPDSPVLSLDAARKLGLVALSRRQLDALSK